MKIFTKFITLLFLASLAGCISINNLKSKDDFSMKPDEGVIVFYKPSGTNIFFRSGDLRGDKFIRDTGFPDNIISGTDGNYVIRKFSATREGRVFGVGNIEQGASYAPACGQDVPIFSIKPGVIQYITHIGVVKNDGAVNVTYRNRLLAAKSYLEETFKVAQIDLVQGDFRTAKEDNCGATGTTFIPIFVRY